MAKAPDKEVYPYILKVDKDSPVQEQTIWHLKILTALDSTASTRRYAKAFKTGFRGESEVIEANLKKAVRGDFLDAVVKVENWQFGYKYPELKAKGRIDVTERAELEQLFDELPDDWAKEIVDAAKGAALLDEIEKKS